MSDLAALEARFVDFKTMASKGTLRLYIEVPIEDTQMVLKVLGTPTSEVPIPVAVALIVANWERKLDERTHVAQAPD